MSIDSLALKIVEAALAFDDRSARAEFVTHRCAGDAALQARVEALLAHDTGGSKSDGLEQFHIRFAKSHRRGGRAA